jgi:hypothetical protein
MDFDAVMLGTATLAKQYFPENFRKLSVVARLVPEQEEMHLPVGLGKHCGAMYEQCFA